MLLVLLRLALPLLLALLLGGNWYWQTGRYLAETDDAYVQGDIVVLTPRIEADVVAIEVADNQPVTRGQVLLPRAVARGGVVEGGCCCCCCCGGGGVSGGEDGAEGGEAGEGEAHRLPGSSPFQRERVWGAVVEVEVEGWTRRIFRL